MKETISVDIGQQAFTLDVDAYKRLSDYFEEVRNHLPLGEDETMNDIEMRFAELFYEVVSSMMSVVTIEMVERAIARMGKPEDFGPERQSCRRGKESNQTPSIRCIRRSRTNRSVAGVCGGLAEYLDVDATIFRLAMLLLILIGGLSIWVYVILWIVIPEEDKKIDLYERR